MWKTWKCRYEFWKNKMFQQFMGKESCIVLTRRRNARNINYMVWPTIHMFIVTFPTFALFSR